MTFRVIGGSRECGQALWNEKDAFDIDLNIGRCKRLDRGCFLERPILLFSYREFRCDDENTPIDIIR